MIIYYGHLDLSVIIAQPDITCILANLENENMICTQYNFETIKSPLSFTALMHLMQEELQ